MAQIPSLRSADSFVILAGTSVTNVGPTCATGSIGALAGVPDLPDGVPTPGERRGNDSLVRRAQRDNAALYDGLASQTPTDSLDTFPVFPDNKLVATRIYRFSKAELTGTLTLSGARDEVLIIQIPGNLIVDEDAAIVLEPDMLSSHIFWVVGGSVTFGRNSSFAGNVLARGDITFGRGVTLAGRALSQQGAVTLDSDAINLCGKLIALKPPALPPGAVGVAYTTTIFATGADPSDPPYAFQLLGALPPGFTGLLSGTPSATGTFEFGVRASSGGAVGVRFYDLSILHIAAPPSPLPHATVCEPYNQPFAPSGGSGSYTTDVRGLPRGLIAPSPERPAITGTPLERGNNFPIHATFTDTVTNEKVCADYQLTVDCGVTIHASLPEGKACQPYIGSLTPSCPGKFTVSVIDGVLPSELVPGSASGVISATPTTPDRYRFTIRIDHESGCSITGTYSITIAPADPLPPIEIDATVCEPIEQVPECTLVGDLPPGLTPTLQGTPKKVGTFPVKAVCDSCPSDATYLIKVTCPDTILPTLPHVWPFYKEFYSVISRPDLKECFTYSVAISSLPHGLWPDNMAGDVIKGLPDKLGQYLIHVTATDLEAPCTVCEDYPLEIIDPPLCDASIVISPPTATFAGTVGVAFPPRTFTASGGTPPYAYNVVATLPPGLSLSLAGVLTGTPTKPGRFNFAVRAVDTTGIPGCPWVYSILIGN